MLHPRFRVSSGNKIALGPGKIELLMLVEKTGSIGEAAKHMKMSYMRAWSLVQTMNECFKLPVIKTIRGGRDRGGATLTDTGYDILKSYQQMEKDSLKATQVGWRSLRKLLAD